MASAVPQLAGDEAELSRYRLTIRRFIPHQRAARQARWELVAEAMHHVAGSRRACKAHPTARALSQRAISCAVREKIPLFERAVGAA